MSIIIIEYSEADFSFTYAGLCETIASTTECSRQTYPLSPANARKLNLFAGN